MFDEIDVIKARRVPLIYVCPPFCEVELSSSSEPIIILNPLPRRRGPTGLVLTTVDGRLILSWDTVAGAICYNVYAIINPEDPSSGYVLIAECVQGPTDVTDFPGPYVVTVITSDGESEPSNPIGGILPPEVCPPEVLLPMAPEDLEIDDELEWDILTVDSTQFQDWPSDSDYKFQEWPRDYSPGKYDVAYISGFFDDSDPMSPCSPGYLGGVTFLSGLGDDDFNLDTFSFLANNVYDIDPPNIEHLASGIFRCELTQNDLETEFQTYWNTGSPRHRWKNQNEHANDGGTLHSLFNSNISYSLNSPIGFEFKMQLIQVEGLIPQPRMLAINEYLSLRENFSDVPAAFAWNGEFPTRTLYTSTNLFWHAVASGAFGGARITWVNDHPYSLNGFGWRLDIFSAGLVLMWRGFKAAGETSEGVYYRYDASTPAGPACLTLSDISEKPWFPPE